MVAGKPHAEDEGRDPENGSDPEGGMAREAGNVGHGVPDVPEEGVAASPGRTEARETAAESSSNLVLSTDAIASLCFWRDASSTAAAL